LGIDEIKKLMAHRKFARHPRWPGFVDVRIHPQEITCYLVVDCSKVIAVNEWVEINVSA